MTRLEINVLCLIFDIYMVVKTNVDYQIIASFATQDETSEPKLESYMFYGR